MTTGLVFGGPADIRPLPVMRGLAAGEGQKSQGKYEGLFHDPENMPSNVRIIFERIRGTS